MGSRTGGHQARNYGWRSAVSASEGLSRPVASMCRGAEVSGDSEFRTPEQEVFKLLEECTELRRTLKAISAQIGRMESRVKRAFPAVASQARAHKANDASSGKANLTSEQALAEFDRVVSLAVSGANEEAE